MPKEVSTVTSNGVCEFCKSEFDKPKMSQHLKFCKQRLAIIAAQEKDAPVQKQHLFHIQAEGKYNSQYWLHFELPASAPLMKIDKFLKTMWISDLDHLSDFDIQGTSYTSHYPYEAGSFGVRAIDQDSIENKEEFDYPRFVDEVAEQLIVVSHFHTQEYVAELLQDWLQEIKKQRPYKELVTFLKNEHLPAMKEYRKKRDAGDFQSAQERNLQYVLAESKKLIVEEILESVEDRTMDVTLENTLSVGQKFSYVYDFGSSTYINLRVLAEREGIIPESCWFGSIACA